MGKGKHKLDLVKRYARKMRRLNRKPNRKIITSLGEAELKGGGHDRSFTAFFVKGYAKLAREKIEREKSKNKKPGEK